MTRLCIETINIIFYTYFKLLHLSYFKQLKRIISKSKLPTYTLPISGPKRLTEALALFRLLVDEDLGRQDIAKRQEHSNEIRVGVSVRQVVNEEVAAFRALDLLRQQPEIIECWCGLHRRCGRCRKRGEPCNTRRKRIRILICICWYRQFYRCVREISGTTATLSLQCKVRFRDSIYTLR